MIDHNDITPAWPAEYICALMADNDKLERMKNAALKRADNACPPMPEPGSCRPGSSARDAAGALADLVLENG